MPRKYTFTDTFWRLPCHAGMLKEDYEVHFVDVWLARIEDNNSSSFLLAIIHRAYQLPNNRYSMKVIKQNDTLYLSVSLAEDKIAAMLLNILQFDDPGLVSFLRTISVSWFKLFVSSLIMLKILPSYTYFLNGTELLSFMKAAISSLTVTRPNFQQLCVFEKRCCAN